MSGFDPEDIDAAVAADLEGLERDHAQSPFVKAYRTWLDGGPAVDNPDALMVASGVPQKMSSFSMIAFAIRDIFISQFGYAVPTSALPRALSGLGPILEIGAGRGYLSALLRQSGIDALATDPDPDHSVLSPAPRAVGECHPAPQRFDVQDLDARAAIAAHPGRTVLCSWPSYQQSWLTEAAHSMQAGTILAVIGEDHGGCTADDSFFEMIVAGALVQLADEARSADVAAAIWSFPGIHDRLQLYRRS